MKSSLIPKAAPLELQHHTEKLQIGSSRLPAAEGFSSAAIFCEKQPLGETETGIVVKSHGQDTGLSQASYQLSMTSGKVILLPEKKPVFYVTDEDGTPIYELRMRRRKRQIVIKVHDPEVDLYELNRYIVKKLREYTESRLDISSATTSTSSV